MVDGHFALVIRWELRANQAKPNIDTLEYSETYP
jgi:hypothetical protein